MLNYNDCPSTRVLVKQRPNLITKKHRLGYSENDPEFCLNGWGFSLKSAKRKHIFKKHLIYACGVNQQFVYKLCHKPFRPQ